MRYLVGTYTRATAAEGIYTISLDPRTGNLSGIELAATADNPSWLEFAGDRLIATNEHGDGAEGGGVSVFKASRGLTLEQQVVSHGADPCHLAVGGGRLACANYSGGSVALYEWAAGRIGSLVAVLRPQGSGPHRRQQAPHPHGVYFLDGELWVPDLGADRIHRYRPSDGAGIGAITIHPGAGPRHLTADGRYLVNELDQTVVAIVRGSSATIASTLPDGVSVPNGAAEIVRRGRHLYVSNRGHDSIAVFATEPALKLIGHQATGLHPRHFTIHPGGRWLLVANKDSNDIWSLPIDPDGLPGAPVSKLACPSPVCLSLWDRDRSRG